VWGRGLYSHRAQEQLANVDQNNKEPDKNDFNNTTTTTTTTTAARTATTIIPPPTADHPPKVLGF